MFLQVLVSHRGVGLSECVGVVSGGTASGSASFNGHWTDWRLSANLADDVARDLVEVMDKTDKSITDVSLKVFLVSQIFLLFIPGLTYFRFGSEHISLPA